MKLIEGISIPLIVIAFIMGTTFIEACKKEQNCYSCKAYYNHRWPDHQQGELKTQEQRCTPEMVNDFHKGWNYPMDTLGYYSECTLN